MKVRMWTIYASPSGKTAGPGVILDLDSVEAKALIAGGYAELYKSKDAAAAALPPVEKATAEPQAETAELPRPRGRPRKNPLP